MKANPTILITCGEASGDLHAANLIAQLRRKIPDANILAFGGDKVRSAGAKLICHIEDYSSIVGLSGVLTNLPRLAALERKLKRVLSDVDLFIPVDYPGLNLRLAAKAKQLQIPVLYYISPQDARNPTPKRMRKTTPRRQFAPAATTPICMGA